MPEKNVREKTIRIFLFISMIIAIPGSILGQPPRGLFVIAQQINKDTAIV
jgi:hypothetical protein